MTTISLGHKILYYLTEVDKMVRGEFHPPISCEIDLSNRCQNVCHFCHFKDVVSDRLIDISDDIYLNLIDQLYKIKCRSITFTGGGEPLLHHNFRRCIVKASVSGFELGLITNGIFLDKYMGMMRLFRFIRISLNASTPETYFKITGRNHFNRVIENIIELVKRVKGYETNVGISMVVTDINKHEVSKFYELGKKIGVDFSQVKPAWKISNIEDTISVKDNYKSFITERYTVDENDPSTKYACLIAGLIGQVGADGKVYYCCVQRGKKNFIVGDLSKEPLIEIMERRYNQIYPDISKCGSCRYMNYAKIYQEVANPKYLMLRHRNFI